MFRNFETNYYLCTDEIKTKWQKNNPKVAYLEEALSFIESIPKSAGDKLLEIVHRVELGERNPIIFSKLEGTEIWEFRTLYNKVKYRLFAFWDTQTDTLVIATHGIIKKTQKTPKKEIAKAERIRQEYFNAKK
jgi:phage-related protein